MMNNVVFRSDSSEWETPQAIFDQLNAEFHFTLDPCSTDENAKCAKHYTKEQDGLIQDWGNEIVFCNPPYGRMITRWIKKCADHAQAGGTAVMLLPVRTDIPAFHEYCIYARIRFVRGRIKFGGAKNNAPFPSMIVIFDQAYKRRKENEVDDE